MSSKLLQYNPYGKFRQGQEQAISEMLQSWEDGNKVIELNAPTAAGKTVDLYVLGRILEKEYGLEKIVFTSPQVALITEGNLFDLPKLVGKRNYPCLAIAGCTAEECPFTSKEEGFAVCEDCSYRVAKNKFRSSKFGATTFARYVADPSINSETSVLLIDESSELEGALLDKATIDLDLKIGEISKKRKVSDQVADLQKFLEKFDVKSHLQKRYDELQIIVSKLGKQCTEYRNEIFKGRKPSSSEIKKLKAIQVEYNHYHRQEVACGHALRYIRMEVPYTIVTEVEEVWNPMLRKKEPKPVVYFKLLQAYVPFADMISSLECVVLASGTPTTDLVTSKYQSVVIPHPIDVSRRLIYYDPVGSMAYASREQTSEKIALRIKQLHDTYSRNTIVHCGSYVVARLIMDHLGRLHSNTVIQEKDYREKALSDWQSKDDAIFLSVRYEEGISLDGPKYPMNIICKIPFPNLSDVWVQSRNKLDGWTWYAIETISRLQQACGRTTRGPEDYSETWILDLSFENLYKRNNNLFQPWFRDALIWKN
jgi:Rad3-related DNA helicase